jgi:hypothetical protein
MMSRIIIFILVLLACITLYLFLYYYTTKRNHYYPNNYPNNNTLDYNYPTNNFNQNSNHLNDNKGFDLDIDVDLDVDVSLDAGVNKDNIKGYENEIMYVSDDLKDGSYVNQFKEIDYSKMKLTDNQIGFDPQPRCSSEPLPYVDVNVNYLLKEK